MKLLFTAMIEIEAEAQNKHRPVQQRHESTIEFIT